MRARHFPVLAVLLLGIAPGYAATLTPLGDVTGGAFESYATGVSGDGSVVVGRSVGAKYEAFRWTNAGGMVALGQLPGESIGSYATAVNGDGTVVVGNGYSSDGQAFRWTSGGGMTSLAPGARLACGVSADGSVVVGANYRWTSAGGLVSLGDLPGGSLGTTARGVSADGTVVIGDGQSASGQEAFRWTATGGIVGLGDLPGGVFGSVANATNANGSVVVGGGNSASGGEAYRWTAADGMVNLGHLFPGNEFTPMQAAALSVSADGSVVVGTDIGEGAWRWTTETGMLSLWNVLLAEGVDPAADGWSFFYNATGVSADGSTIVGYGNRNGNAEAFIAVVPEPSGLALLGIAVYALLRRRRSSRPVRCRPLEERQ